MALIDATPVFSHCLQMCVLAIKTRKHRKYWKEFFPPEQEGVNAVTIQWLLSYVSDEKRWIPAGNFLDCSRSWLGFCRVFICLHHTFQFLVVSAYLTQVFLNCYSFFTTGFQATRTSSLQTKFKDFQYQWNFIQQQCYQEKLRRVQKVANNIPVHGQSFKESKQTCQTSG